MCVKSSSTFFNQKWVILKFQIHPGIWKYFDFSVLNKVLPFKSYYIFSSIRTPFTSHLAPLCLALHPLISPLKICLHRKYLFFASWFQCYMTIWITCIRNTNTRHEDSQVLHFRWVGKMAYEIQLWSLKMGTCWIILSCVLQVRESRAALAVKCLLATVFESLERVFSLFHQTEIQASVWEKPFSSW